MKYEVGDELATPVDVMVAHPWRNLMLVRVDTVLGRRLNPNEDHYGVTVLNRRAGMPTRTNRSESYLREGFVSDGRGNIRLPEDRATPEPEEEPTEGTATGRMSSRRPAMQQVPRRTWTPDFTPVSPDDVQAAVNNAVQIDDDDPRLLVTGIFRTRHAPEGYGFQRTYTFIHLEPATHAGEVYHPGDEMVFRAMELPDMARYRYGATSSGFFRVSGELLEIPMDAAAHMGPLKVSLPPIHKAEEVIPTKPAKPKKKKMFDI